MARRSRDGGLFSRPSFYTKLAIEGPWRTIPTRLRREPLSKGAFLRDYTYPWGPRKIRRFCGERRKEWSGWSRRPLGGGGTERNFFRRRRGRAYSTGPPALSRKYDVLPSWRGAPPAFIYLYISARPPHRRLFCPAAALAAKPPPGVGERIPAGGFPPIPISRRNSGTYQRGRIRRFHSCSYRCRCSDSAGASPGPAPPWEPRPR